MRIAGRGETHGRRRCRSLLTCSAIPYSSQRSSPNADRSTKLVSGTACVWYSKVGSVASVGGGYQRLLTFSQENWLLGSLLLLIIIIFFVFSFTNFLSAFLKCLLRLYAALHFLRVLFQQFICFRCQFRRNG